MRDAFGVSKLYTEHRRATPAEEVNRPKRRAKGVKGLLGAKSPVEGPLYAYKTDEMHGMKPGYSVGVMGPSKEVKRFSRLVGGDAVSKKEAFGVEHIAKGVPKPLQGPRVAERTAERMRVRRAQVGTKTPEGERMRIGAKYVRARGMAWEEGQSMSRAIAAGKVPAPDFSKGKSGYPKGRAPLTLSNAKLHRNLARKIETEGYVQKDAFGIEKAGSPSWVRDASIATGSGLAASIAANQLPQSQKSTQSFLRRKKKKVKQAKQNAELQGLFLL